MRAITEEEIESALRGTAQRMEFSPGEQARLPSGQVTFIGSIVDAVIRIDAGAGPRDYGNVLDVATYNNVLAVEIGRSDRRAVPSATSRHGKPRVTSARVPKLHAGVLSH